MPVRMTVPQQTDAAKASTRELPSRQESKGWIKRERRSALHRQGSECKALLFDQVWLLCSAHLGYLHLRGGLQRLCA